MARRKHYKFYDDFKATAVAPTEILGIKANHVAEVLDIDKISKLKLII